MVVIKEHHERLEERDFGGKIKLRAMRLVLKMDTQPQVHEQPWHLFMRIPERPLSGHFFRSSVVKLCFSFNVLARGQKGGFGLSWASLIRSLEEVQHLIFLKN